MQVINPRLVTFQKCLSSPFFFSIELLVKVYVEMCTNHNLTAWTVFTKMNNTLDQHLDQEIELFLLHPFIVTNETPRTNHHPDSNYYRGFTCFDLYVNRNHTICALLCLGSFTLHLCLSPESYSIVWSCYNVFIHSSVDVHTFGWFTFWSYYK